MKSHPKHPRLYLRGTRYYFRAAIPADIKETYGKTEETYSLKTGDFAEALRRCRTKSAEIDQRFEDHRNRTNTQKSSETISLTEEQIKYLKELYYYQFLKLNDELRSNSSYSSFGIDETSEEVWGYFNTHEDGYTLHLDEYKAMHSEGKAHPHFRDFSKTFLCSDQVGIQLNATSPSWEDLAYALQGEAIKATRVIDARNRGEPLDTPPKPKNLPKPAINASVAIEEWLKENERISWRPKTKKEYENWIYLFIAARGDRPIDNYKLDDGRKFRQILLQLPPNWTKNKHLKGLGIAEASKKADMLELSTMSISNVNKIIGIIKSFWSWVEDNYEDAPANPIGRLRLKKQTTAREERDSFTAEHLSKIFNAPLYTGCQSYTHCNTPGDLRLMDTGRYWLPLIALFSGMRLGEIAQLYTSDIKHTESFYYFDINDDGEDKNLKTSNSKRQIPLHPELIKLGLIGLHKVRERNKDRRLFPDLTFGKSGYYSDPYSKFFGRFLKSLDLKTSTLTFHSFRHTFEDGCRNNGITYEVMNAIQGHSESGMAGRYGSGHSLAHLNEQIQNVRYQDLSLEHLHAYD